ncbi:MAG: SRPBCC domain-containing protein [Kangiellaceae bacterium]|nr:SRPBCC domain-containing protein [Kangiellaceae bacterium]MCW9016348.1 SRPBCC domain-containing protein [Kangiellaceae bacterium]
MYQLTIEQNFNMPLTKLFDAWCKVETIKQWFAPGEMMVPEATADVKVGGNYRIVMKSPDGEEHIVGGEYLQVEANKKLVFSWQWEGSPHTTKVEIDFAALDDSNASLCLTHSEFADQEACDKHNQGWNGCLANLHKCAD